MTVRGRRNPVLEMADILIGILHYAAGETRCYDGYTSEWHRILLELHPKYSLLQALRFNSLNFSPLLEEAKDHLIFCGMISVINGGHTFAIRTSLSAYWRNQIPAERFSPNELRELEEIGHAFASKFEVAAFP